MDDKKHAAVPSAAANNQVPRRDIIVIGGSAGSLEAMLAVAIGLPADHPGSVFIVSHIGTNRSHLPELLSRSGALPARHAEDGEPMRPGTIYVAPPDRHMLVGADHIRLSRGKKHPIRLVLSPGLDSE